MYTMIIYNEAKLSFACHFHFDTGLELGPGTLAFAFSHLQQGESKMKSEQLCPCTLRGDS